MPIYEYRCKQCRRRSSHLVRSVASAGQPVCDHCGSSDLARLMSTFAFHRSGDVGANLPSSETLSDFNEDDPKSYAEWIQGMRQDMGEEFASAEYGELMREMEAGQMGDNDGDGGPDL